MSSETHQSWTSFYLACNTQIYFNVYVFFGTRKSESLPMHIYSLDLNPLIYCGSYLQRDKMALLVLLSVVCFGAAFAKRFDYDFDV